LFEANKDIPEVGVINWSLTVVKRDLVNAVAFPVRFCVFRIFEFYKNKKKIIVQIFCEKKKKIFC
jgi:hypothetical protein